jgi:diguanylate cyclase (GGDEF)-like protein
MRALLRDYDICGRFGGEEFALFLPQTTAEEAHQVADRLREKIAQITVPISGQPDGPSQLGVTISIGVATLHDSRRDLNDLLVAADHALYQAKEAGRNMVCVSGQLPVRYGICQ